jgi:hypothetical protein
MGMDLHEASLFLQRGIGLLFNATFSNSLPIVNNRLVRELWVLTWLALPTSFPVVRKCESRMERLMKRVRCYTNGLSQGAWELIWHAFNSAGLSQFQRFINYGITHGLILSNFGGFLYRFEHKLNSGLHPPFCNCSQFVNLAKGS